ncbi:MAG: acyl-CoA dehydrogenase family protein, partial [Myxococcota bacterium]
MRYELSDDQAMIQDAVRRFAEAEVAPHAYEWDGAAAAQSSIFAALAELGLMGMRVSDSAGGAGLDPLAALLAIETLAVSDGGLAWTVALHNLLALPMLEAAGHEQVASLAAGEGVAAWFEAPLNAVVDGRSVRLTGTATLVPWARQARLLVGWVPKVGAVAISPAADGVNTTPTEGAMGLRSSAPSTVRFEDSTGLRLEGPDAQAALPAWFGLARAAVAIGVARGALTAATRYAQERQQFGRPIAQFQAVQWMLAETATEIDAAALLAWSAAGVSPSLADSARAALYALPAATRAGMRAVQIFGGNGYVREYPVERCLRDAKALEVLRPVDDDQDRVV